MQHGYEFAFDYKKDQLGQKHFFIANGVRYIMVEGSWFLDGMPEDLINAVKDARRKNEGPLRISKKTMHARIAPREAYRLEPLGTRKANGDQRYTLPKTSGYVLYDRNNPQVLLPKPTVGTVTIPLSEGLKWAQKYPFQSPEWKKAFNLRSAVERKNAQLKSPRFEDLDNAAKRPFRGYAWHSIAVAMLIVAHNVRVLEAHFRILEGISDPRNKHRLTRVRKSRNDGSLAGVLPQRDSRRAA